MSLHRTGCPLSLRLLASSALALTTALFAACGTAPTPSVDGPEGVTAASLTELVVNGTFSGTTTAPWRSVPYPSTWTPG